MNWDDVYYDEEIPGFKGRINSIVEFVEDPCDADWYVYFKTALPALGTMVVQLVMPSMLDVVRGYARPRSSLGRGHKRKKGKKGRRGRGIPDTSDLIARMLPGFAESKGRKVSQGVNNLWKIDNIGQRLFWYWLVADVTLDGFYVWTSLINQSVQCSAQHRRGFRASRSHENTVTQLGGWRHATGMTAEVIKNGWTWNTYGGGCPIERGMVIYSTEIRNIDTRFSQIQFRIRTTDTEANPIHYGEVLTIPPGGSTAAVIQATIYGPTSFAFECNVEGGQLVFSETLAMGTALK